VEEKQSRLRAFMEGNQQLLEGWEAQERRQKAKFKSRLKLAALTDHKSLEKSPKKQNLKHPLKHSLKSLLPAPARLSSNHFHNRHGASERLRSVEGQAFRYYL
jgi:predicted ATPase